MRPEMTDIVYPIIASALQQRQRLEQGEVLDIDAEQAELRRLLLSPGEARQHADYGGDGDVFLGIRYALTCWLDELFIDSSWKPVWSERKLEEALYGTNDRAWKFWHQAKLAQRRTGTDPLEVFYLCVMLGFRGEGPEAPETLQSWRDTVQARLMKDQEAGWTAPPERPLEMESAPLRGGARLRRACLALVPALLILIPLLTFFLINLIRE